MRDVEDTTAEKTRRQPLDREAVKALAKALYRQGRKATPEGETPPVWKDTRKEHMQAARGMLRVLQANGFDLVATGAGPAPGGGGADDDDPADD